MFLKLRKNSMCSVERGTGNGKMKTGKKKKKQKMDNWAKVQVCFCSHFSFSGPRACFPFPIIERGARIILIIFILLTFFSHFVSTHNTCTICRRRIPVREVPSTLFQGCFITKTFEVSEPHWDIRGTKNSGS